MNDLCTNHLSFSQLTLAEQCPYAYYLTRIARIQPRENAFAQAGSLVHALLANWARGDLPANDLQVCGWPDSMKPSPNAFRPIWKPRGIGKSSVTALPPISAPSTVFPGMR